ncbi:MAG: amylo-alpha-1,6-glucosidase [Euryarchaeota archaeon]|nr:amylo-alpha-1,6-glucosidase [Euryarchaeota archaeon]
MSRFNALRQDLSNYGSGTQKEWIVTNGLGGYASSTIIGTNTRTYHGLLVAALNPPVDRTLFLSSLDEEIRLNGETYHLASHKYPGTVHPEGFTYLKEFSLNPFPTAVYQIGDIEVTRCVFMVHEANTTIIRYRLNNVADGADNTILRVFPLVNMRDFHSITSSNDIDLVQDASRAGTKLRSGTMTLSVTSNMRYHSDGMWYYNFEYDREHARGLACHEDNYNPGYFDIELKQGENQIFVAASTSDLSDLTVNDIEDLYNKEVERLCVLEKRSGLRDDLALKLTLAADSFIVRRTSTNSRSIIAGYHWFSDWGRDAMISLPGLTLVTGRFDDGKQILLSFAKNCRDGLIPNRFADSDKYPPDYNTVDASLWFVHAVGRYFAYTGDTTFVGTIWDTIADIISNYTEGTHFGIRMDDDGLITHGSQLTWMDAKIGTFEVTPRRGKTCEINALWYNALRTASHLAEHLQKDPSTYELLAGSAKRSFTDVFWNQDEMCLFDCVGVDEDNMIIKDPAIRPNQIFSVSLPYTMLPRNKEIDVVRRVEQDLLTPMGLRTLSCDNVAYKGRYEGNSISRDMAYHNGTVWPWLMGPYVSAYTKVNDHSRSSRDHARLLLQRFDEQLQDSGIGTICEIYDGDYPYIPRGCISQAWSVAEILRAYVEDVLYEGCMIDV